MWHFFHYNWTAHLIYSFSYSDIYIYIYIYIYCMCTGTHPDFIYNAYHDASQLLVGHLCGFTVHVV